MYNHILIAVDGSDIASTAARHAIGLAKQVGAKLTAVTVSEPYEAVAFADAAVFVDPAEYTKRMNENADAVLAAVAGEAKSAGIECNTVHQTNHWPYDGIIAAAKQASADLIVIGSHGRRGLEGLLLGSQAMKLLTHTKIPTLVIR